MKKTWLWSFENAQGTVKGDVQGVDLRDAVSHIMKSRLFDQAHGISPDIVDHALDNEERQLTIAQDGFRLEVKLQPEMYVVRDGQMLVLRQQRFRAQLAVGREHPHDVCAIARSVEEMHSMIDKHWPDADYSAVAEMPEGAKGELAC